MLNNWFVYLKLDDVGRIYIIDLDSYFVYGGFIVYV